MASSGGNPGRPISRKRCGVELLGTTAKRTSPTRKQGNCRLPCRRVRLVLHGKGDRATYPPASESIGWLSGETTMPNSRDRRSFGLEPKDAAGYNQQAISYALDGRLEEAVASLEEVLRLK